MTGGRAKSAALAEGFRGASPRPLAAHLSAGAADVQQAVALAAGLDDPRFPWRPSLRGLAAELAAHPGAADRAAFARQVAAEGVAELERAVQGVVAYRAAEPVRRPAPPEEIWRRGAVRLLAYPTPQNVRATLIAIPSLVNGSAILDLTRARSFLRGLAAEGVRAFLLDWGEPGAEERRFRVVDYAMLRALPALDAALARIDADGQAGRPACVLGHCMAGAIAAQAARFRRDRIAKLVLMAAPWDYRPMRPLGAPHQPRREDISQLVDICGAVFGGVPADVLNSIFFLRDPLQAVRKFGRYSLRRRRRAEGRLFVAVEDWLNDGMRLAAPAARDLFVSWALDNTLAAGRWPTPEDPLRLGALDLPTLVIASRSDTLTPYESAVAALEGAPRAELLEPKAGHVGMVVGGRAEAELWAPLAAWLTA